MTKDPNTLLYKRVLRILYPSRKILNLESLEDSKFF